MFLLLPNAQYPQMSSAHYSRTTLGSLTAVSAFDYQAIELNSSPTDIPPLRLSYLGSMPICKCRISFSEAAGLVKGMGFRCQGMAAGVCWLQRGCWLEGAAKAEAVA